MGNLIVQFNANNWNSFYATTLTAVSNGSSYTPIPKFSVPLLLDSHIIAVSVSCSNAKPSWHFGGFLNQHVPTGLTVGGVSDADVVQKRRLWIDRLTLMIFPPLTPTYSVTIEVPKWFQDATISIFTYVGPKSDSTENLINSIQSQLTQIQNLLGP